MSSDNYEPFTKFMDRDENWYVKIHADEDNHNCAHVHLYKQGFTQGCRYDIDVPFCTSCVTGLCDTHKFDKQQVPKLIIERLEKNQGVFMREWNKSVREVNKGKPLNEYEYRLLSKSFILQTEIG